MGKVARTLMVCAAIGFAAQAVNAELVVQMQGPNGENKLRADPGDSVDVYLNVDGPAADTYNQFGLDIFITPGLTAVGYAFVDQSPNPNPFGGANDFTDITDGANLIVEVARAVNGSPDFVTPPGNIMVFTFDTTGTVDGDTFAFDVDAPNAFFDFGRDSRDVLAGQTFTLNIIPEPMTLALLGVGGLVALRRRRTA